MAEDRNAGDVGGRLRPADRRAGDFGSRLRQAREQKGVSLREIANATKISVRALEALERNDISHLPGGIFSRSFVRAYAVQAGLDPDETVDDFVRQFPHDSVIAGHAPSTSIDESDDEANRRTARVVMRLVAITIPVAAVVLYLTAANRGAGEAGAERRAAGANAAGASTAARVATGITTEVTALKACTLTVAVDGQTAIVKELSVGARQTFEAARELAMTVSDPSAIEVRVNGAAGRTWGPPGIPATVRLTADNYRTFVVTP